MQMEQEHFEKCCSFTLIELLAVIAIIGVLSGMLLVGIKRARETAWKSSCLSNLRQIGQGLTMYLDNNKRFPLVTNLPSLGLNNLPPISWALSGYIPTREVFRCRADTLGYYQKEESSYEWNIHLNGKPRNLKGVFGPFAPPYAESDIPVLWDYESFHGMPDSAGSRNVLFLDGHSEGL